MKFLLGTKVGMTQIFDENSKAIPVTVIQAGPVTVTQIKSKEKDNYNAVQLGFGRKKKLSKPIQGHLGGKLSSRWLREYRVDEAREAQEVNSLKVGDKIDVSVFEEGDEVTLSSISKGKGFQGVVKRHGFSGLSKTHGTKKKHRSGGSIGSAFPQKVFKGRKMAGRMGQDRTTRRGVKIIKIEKINYAIIPTAPMHCSGS